jgi:hypothetical protein
MLITANQPFGEWGRIFPDPAMTLAAIDRLVHHATILELNVENYRRRAALRRRRDTDAPATARPPCATIIRANTVLLRRQIAILIAALNPPSLSPYTPPRQIARESRCRSGG